MTYSPRELARSGVPEPRCRLRAYRRSIRRTAADVALLAGVTSQTVLVYERGEPVRGEERIIAAYADLTPLPDYSVALRRFREVRGWTVARAARAAGVHPDSWSQIEQRGHSYSPTQKMRAKLDAVLGEGGGDVQS